MNDMLRNNGGVPYGTSNYEQSLTVKESRDLPMISRIFRKDTKGVISAFPRLSIQYYARPTRRVLQPSSNNRNYEKMPQIWIDKHKSIVFFENQKPVSSYSTEITDVTKLVTNQKHYSLLYPIREFIKQELSFHVKKSVPYQREYDVEKRLQRYQTNVRIPEDQDAFEPTYGRVKLLPYMKEHSDIIVFLYKKNYFITPSFRVKDYLRSVTYKELTEEYGPDIADDNPFAELANLGLPDTKGYFHRTKPSEKGDTMVLSPKLPSNSFIPYNELSAIDSLHGKGWRKGPMIFEIVDTNGILKNVVSYKKLSDGTHFNKDLNGRICKIGLIQMTTGGSAKQSTRTRHSSGGKTKNGRKGKSVARTFKRKNYHA
jgi:uncharacterized protein YeeX (DUF496 family)